VEEKNMAFKKMMLYINGVERMLVVDPDSDTLATALRRIGLTGVKVGCGVGQCGSCSIILDGEVVRSCTRRMKNIKEYCVIETIEGLGTASRPHPLQQAWVTYGGVQCGFCTPGFIMSAKALLDGNPNPTRQDVRDWFTRYRNVCRCTGYKPIVDAVMAGAAVMRGEKTMEDITFKDPADKEYYGSRLPKPTALAKTLGLADFGGDMELKLPGRPLYVAIVQPRVTSHAKLLAIRTEAAEAMPGVVKVVTHKDVKGINRVPIPIDHPRSTMDGFERPVLNDEKIFRYGDAVALVIAESNEEARAAAAAVTVDFEPLPEYMNALDAAAPDAMRIHDKSDNIYVRQPVIKGEEDARDVIENSEYAVEGSFYASREPHLSVEGDVMQGYWDADGNMIIQCKSQSLSWNRAGISAGVGYPMEQVHIVENHTGGSFGWATCPASFALMGACLMLIKDRPLALSMTWEEFMHHSGKRAPLYANGRLACDKNGKLTALEYEALLDRGPFTEVSEHILDKIMRFACYPYSVPNVNAIGKVIFTNHNFATSYRGFGSTQVYTMTEQLVDMLAEKAGIDPFEFRMLNVARPGDTTINSYPFKGYPMVDLMERARPVYETAREKARNESTDKIKRGVGIVCGGFCVGLGPFDHSEVALELNDDGTFSHFSGWEAQGQGADIGAMTHVLKALKPLNVTPEQVRLVMNDTTQVPDTGIAAASRSHFMAGLATIDASNQLMNAMRKDDGSYRTYEEMVAEGIPTKYKGVYDVGGIDACPLDPNTGVGDPTPAHNYAVFVAEVAVDAETGEVSCIGMHAFADCGIIGNRLAAEGQAYGGLSHGISYALKAEYEDLKKHGSIAGAGVPYCNEIPDNIDVEFVENPRDRGPHGSSGLSECFQSSGHVAVLNAIYNAVGARIYELPARPEKVLAAMDAKAKGKELKPDTYYLGGELYDELEEIKDNPV
jgi:aldehyde oxidoreductase